MFFFFKQTGVVSVRKGEGENGGKMSTVLLYSGDRSARWKVVIGGKSNICSFSFIHLNSCESHERWAPGLVYGNRAGIEFQQKEGFNGGLFLCCLLALESQAGNERGL